MAGLPKKMYYALIKPGGKPLKYGEKGGGAYANEENAISRYASLKGLGSNVELLVTEVDWQSFELIEEYITHHMWYLTCKMPGCEWTSCGEPTIDWMQEMNETRASHMEEHENSWRKRYMKS